MIVMEMHAQHNNYYNNDNNNNHSIYVIKTQCNNYSIGISMNVKIN